MTYSSRLHYYQERRINPVPIELADAASWDRHVAKRRNLYQQHLGIPLSLLRDRSVLEFGCNSGENALVLASFGANLTLVEPHKLVLSQLMDRFEKFGLVDRIVRLIQEEIADFHTHDRYDIVIAEGFLHTLPNRDQMLQKICGLIAPGGLGVVSWEDLHGNFIEFTRKLIFWRALRLEGIEDGHSPASLDLASRLYLHDFQQLNASRPFQAWWQDVLLNPSVRWHNLWTYQQLIPILETSGCEFYSSSPRWVSADSYTWYKNVANVATRHRRILAQWFEVFPFFLTGTCPASMRTEPVSDGVVEAVSTLLLSISEYVADRSRTVSAITYPPQLGEYLESFGDAQLIRYNGEIKDVYRAVQSNSVGEVVGAYHRAGSLRRLWGAPYHYICFSKLASSG